jgi:hypothetical protein
VIFGKNFQFSQKSPQNVGGGRKNFIFSPSSHTFLSNYNETIKCELLAEGCDAQNNNHKNFVKKATRVTL